MKDFNFYAPTEIVFGRQAEEQVAQLVRKYNGNKVLLHFGGQSAKKSGLLDKMMAVACEGRHTPMPRAGCGLHPRSGRGERH